MMIPEKCQGTNCGTTTCQHSRECLEESASEQGWPLPAAQQQAEPATPSEDGRDWRNLLTRASGQIQHLAECVENLGEDLEDDDVSEDVEEARAIAHEIDAALSAQPARQVGGEEMPALPDGWLIELGFDVLDRQFRFIESKSHTPTIKLILPACEVDDSSAWNLRDDVASRIRSALAPAAVAVDSSAPLVNAFEQVRTMVGNDEYADDVIGFINQSIYNHARLNRRAIPLELLERVVFEVVGLEIASGLNADATDELRALLGKS